MILALLLTVATAADRAMPLADRKIIMAAVGDKLLDGESARWRWPKDNQDRVGYCGWVNAKNSIGAYTGFKPYFVTGAHANGSKGDGRFKVFSVELPGEGNDAIIETMCRTIGMNITDGPPAGD